MAGKWFSPCDQCSQHWAKGPPLAGLQIRFYQVAAQNGLSAWQSSIHNAPAEQQKWVGASVWDGEFAASASGNLLGVLHFDVSKCSKQL